MRQDVEVLGKIIGTCVGWEDCDTFIFQFLEFKPNEFGERFLRNNFNEHEIEILNIDFENGTVNVFESGNNIEIKPDWSVFNA